MPSDLVRQCPNFEKVPELGSPVPPFVGDNDAPHRFSAPPQRGLYPLSLASSSTIVRQEMAALVLNPLTVFEMKKITWHTRTSPLPNERSLCPASAPRGLDRFQLATPVGACHWTPFAYRGVVSGRPGTFDTGSTRPLVVYRRPTSRKLSSPKGLRPARLAK
jgi:hypothetical protein